MNEWFGWFVAGAAILVALLVEAWNARTYDLAVRYAFLGFVVAWTIAVPAPLLLMTAAS